LRESPSFLERHIGLAALFNLFDRRLLLALLGSAAERRFRPLLALKRTSWMFRAACLSQQRPAKRQRQDQPQDVR
jgi:hypothetical protein